MEMLLTGDPVTAEHALTIGLVNRVAAPGTEREEAIALAHHIAAKSPAAIRIGKPAFYAQLEMDFGEAAEFAADVMVDNMLERRCRRRHRRLHRQAQAALDRPNDGRRPRWITSTTTTATFAASSTP